MAKITTVDNLVRKLKELNPGVVITSRHSSPNTIFLEQWPERLSWPEGITYDPQTEEITGLKVPITCSVL